MRLAPELLLALLIIALYLNDSAKLLQADEAILEKGMAGWKASFGTRRFTLLGKHAYLGGFIPPHTPTFRLAWSMESECPPAPGWEEYARLLRPCGWGGAVLFLLVIVLGPVALLTRSGDMIILALIAVIYFGVLGLFGMAWFRRERLGLSKGYCLKLGAEMLLCPPIAANFCRRLSLQHTVQEDFVSACRRLLSTDKWALVACQIKLRIDDELETEEVGSSRHARLSQRRGQL